MSLWPAIVLVITTQCANAVRMQAKYTIITDMILQSFTHQAGWKGQILVVCISEVIDKDHIARDDEQQVNKSPAQVLEKYVSEGQTHVSFCLGVCDDVESPAIKRAQVCAH